jgi:hypothetical protein
MFDGYSGVGPISRGHCHGNRVRSSGYRIECQHGPAQLPPPALPARDHPARDLALSPLHPELPRRRGTAGRTRARHLLRNGAAMGAEVRSGDRATAAPASPAALGGIWTRWWCASPASGQRQHAVEFGAIIGQRTGSFDPTTYRDRCQEPCASGFRRWITMACDTAR